MKKQKVVRTYPHNYTNPTTALRESLDKGWLVVMCNNTYLQCLSKTPCHVMNRNHNYNHLQNS